MRQLSLYFDFTSSCKKKPVVQQTNMSSNNVPVFCFWHDVITEVILWGPILRANMNVSWTELGHSYQIHIGLSGVEDSVRLGSSPLSVFMKQTKWMIDTLGLWQEQLWSILFFLKSTENHGLTQVWDQLNDSNILKCAFRSVFFLLIREGCGMLLLFSP